MSDTDDTDVLLLIPPDFFLINSDTDSSIDGNWNDHCGFHCDLVENLVGEVGNLKSRVDCIENISVPSSVYSMDRMTESEMSNRNFQFAEEFRNRFMPNSTNSTPQKPRTKLVANSLPSTPSSDRDNSRRRTKNYERQTNPIQVHPTKSQSHHNIQAYNGNDADISSFTSSPEKKNDKDVLGEIDQFLSHVKTIKRFVTAKKLENEYQIGERDHQSLPISFDNSPLKLSDLKGEGDYKFDKRKGLDLKDIDNLIQNLEEQQEKMEKIPVTNRIVEGNETQTQTWKPGENKNTVPNYHYGIRDMMYAKEDAENLASNIDEYLNKQCNPTNSNLELDGDSDTTNEITPPTVFENPIDSYLLKKPQNELTRNIVDIIPPKTVNVFDFVTKSLPQNTNGKSKTMEEIVKKSVQSNVQGAPLRHKRNITNEVKANSMQLYGLPDLWKKGVNYSQSVDQQVYLAKFEEEKMRRQHCEKLIQELQLKHLEMQQRLAVAVQVDCAKDAAILKFHKAWEKVADRWAALETERNQLSQKLNNVKGKTDHELTEAKKKVVQYETEMSKALDLAHTNQEKVNNLEFDKNTLMIELETVKKDLELLKLNLQTAENERDELRSNLLKFEEEKQQDKSLIENLQMELNNQKQKIQMDLACFQNEIKHLREEKSKFEKELMDTNSACNLLESKNKTLENTVEIGKKNEKVLQHEINKLIEQQDKGKSELRNFYQQQVETLVKDKLKEFQTQLEHTEKSLHEELQLREQNIAKTAAKQLQKFTDKHQVEIQLLEQKHKEEINLYEIQIQQLKHLIATQQNKLDHMQMKRNNIAQELKTVMEAQWSEALRIIDSGKTPTAPTSDTKDDLRHQPPELERQREPPHGVMDVIVNTPRTSRDNQEWHEQHSNDLHKYIKMLLDKEPGNPTEGGVPNSVLRNTSSSDCVDMSSHPEGSSRHNEETEKKTYSTVSKEYRASKPPWK